ncbi:hypothetical protein AAFF_G00396670 [Aldrovandia affinis]|uniref:Uncharacterized protein n=1 Tax=Aldrovandia affinis TaxID=143900 RepID=A0AAD7VYT8_9TELE|nr:hypothetical protein AAFF_G00396670 [Aldrovandia affinis]
MTVAVEILSCLRERDTKPQTARTSNKHNPFFLLPLKNQKQKVSDEAVCRRLSGRIGSQRLGLKCSSLGTQTFRHGAFPGGRVVLPSHDQG